MSFMVSYVLVCGHPRSGTTMMASLLSSHPEMSVFHELGVFDVEGAPTLEQYLERVRAYSRLGLAGDESGWLRRVPVLERFQAVMRARAPDNVRFEEALSGLRETLRQPRILGDKLPAYLGQLAHFPDDPRVTYVILYRDGRAVVNSAIERRRDGHWAGTPWATQFDHPVTAARSWLSAVDLMEQQAHRAVILRYEDLVTDPRRALTPLADILGIDVRQFDFRIPRQVSLNRWREKMDPEHIRLVEATAGETLQRLGYRE
jgi:hypothetical protein